MTDEDVSDGTGKGANEGVNVYQGPISKGEGVNEDALTKVIADAFPASAIATREGIQELVKAIAVHQKRRVPEYVQITGIAQSTVERYIRWLRAEGLIDYSGGAKSGGYFITGRMIDILRK